MRLPIRPGFVPLKSHQTLQDENAELREEIRHLKQQRRRYQTQRSHLRNRIKQFLMLLEKLFPGVTRSKAYHKIVKPIKNLLK